MSVTENIDRIEQGKTSIISTIKSKGVDVPSGILINEIAPYINEIQGGGGSSELPEVGSDEDILAIENVDTVEGTVFLNNPNNIAIQYSTNGSEFNDYTTATEVSIKPSEKVYFKWSEVIGKYTLLGFDSIVKSSVKYKVYGELKQGNNEYAYYNMFRGERNLTDASKLQLTATIVNKACYSNMFYNCSNLTTAPALPATTLQQSCYHAMFQKCSSLVQAPALPATTLQISCYSQMFWDCTSLTTAPELPATELPISDAFQGSYRYMFYGCTSLNYVKHHIVDWNTSNTIDWLKDVAPNGTVECPIDSTIPSDSTSGVPTGWTRVDILVIENIDRIEQGKTSIISTIKSKGVNVPSGILINEIAPYINEIQGGGGSSELPEVAENEDILVIENLDTVEGTVFMNNPRNIAIQYSTNGSQFNDYTTATEVSIKPSEKVYFKWSDVISNSNNSTALVNSTVKYKVYGELKQGNNKNAYYKMFNNESNLVDVSELKLPAMTLAPYCYYKMFYGCTSLTTATELPATQLKEDCYYQMFNGCTSLTTAPELPATELADYCYYNMFDSCASLTTAPALPATTLQQSCYQFMFYGCTKLTTAPELPATTLADKCYYGMFYGCTSLTTATELPATQLKEHCYYQMFYGCTSLTTAPELPATELADYCYYNMFGGCKSLNTAPELPATTLVRYCYSQMFYGCKALNYVKHNIIEWNTSNTSSWLSNVASSGTMYCPLNSTIPSDSTSGIPSGWTRVDF